jgi:hypothetical protein
MHSLQKCSHDVNPELSGTKTLLRFGPCSFCRGKGKQTISRVPTLDVWNSSWRLHRSVHTPVRFGGRKLNPKVLHFNDDITQSNSTHHVRGNGMRVDCTKRLMWLRICWHTPHVQHSYMEDSTIATILHTDRGHRNCF